MDNVDIQKARKHLSKLVEKAAEGEPLIIAKDCKPLVKVVANDTSEAKMPKRLGFMKGKFSVPDDFDRMFEKEIEQMFYGKE